MIWQVASKGTYERYGRLLRKGRTNDMTGLLREGRTLHNGCDKLFIKHYTTQPRLIFAWFLLYCINLAELGRFVCNTYKN